MSRAPTEMLSLGRRVCVVLLAVLFVVLVMPARQGRSESDGSRVVAVRNRTGTDLYGLFLAPTGSGAWGEDLLAGRRLDEGERLDVTFPWGARAIGWDIRVENREGRAVEWKEIPLRRLRRVTLYFQGGRPVARGE